MSKINSKRFKKEFEVELCTPIEHRDVIVVKHSSLVDIINCQLDGVAKVTTCAIKTDRNHCISKCTISDDSGRNAEGIGEVTEKTITKIFKDKPYTFAANIAFDRAAKLYLMLDDKVYSNLEIPAVNNSTIAAENAEETFADASEETAEEVVGTVDETPADSTEGDAPADISADIPDEVVVEDDVSEPEAETKPAMPTPAAGTDKRKHRTATPTPTPTPQPAQKPAPEKSGNSSVEELGKTIVNFGKYGRDGGITIEEIFKKDKGYLEWLSKSGNATVHKNAKAYLEAMT